MDDQILSWFPGEDEMVSMQVYWRDHFGWAIIFCILWFVLWGLWFRLKWRRYQHRKCGVAYEWILERDTMEAAGQIQKVIDDQIDAACVFVDKDKDTNLYIISRDKDRYKRWVGWDRLKSILWLFGSVGLGIKIYRIADKDKWLKSPPPEDVDVVHEWSWKDKTKWFFSIIILSGGALLSIIAFVLLIVMC